jgi:hypothetical protein
MGEARNPKIKNNLLSRRKAEAIEIATGVLLEIGRTD